MQKVTGIGVYSLAKVQGLMGAILGLLFALFNIGLTLLVSAIGAGMGGGGVANELLGVGMNVTGFTTVGENRILGTIHQAREVWYGSRMGSFCFWTHSAFTEDRTQCVLLSACY